MSFVFTNKLRMFTLVAFPAGSPSGDVCQHRRANQPEVGQFIGLVLVKSNELNGSQWHCLARAALQDFCGSKRLISPDLQGAVMILAS